MLQNPQHIVKGKNNTDNYTCQEAVNTWCVYSLPRQLDSFSLGLSPRSSRGSSHTQTLHPALGVLRELGEGFQAADWNSGRRMKSMTFRMITRAKIKRIFGLPLFQRLTNPSLGCSSNGIHSRLWPLRNNRRVAPPPGLCHTHIAKLSDKILIYCKFNLYSPLENGKLSCIYPLFRF